MPAGSLEKNAGGSSCDTRSGRRNAWFMKLMRNEVGHMPLRWS